MKTKDVVAVLQELDPTGELTVRMYDDRSLMPVDIEEIYKEERPTTFPTPTEIPYPLIMIEPY